MKITSKDGTLLDVDVSGPEDAPPLVLFHGVSSSRSTYDWLPDQVTANRRVVRADFRGHGRSDWAPGRYLMERYFEDAVAVLEQATTRPAVMVGFSLGGCMAWTIAQRRPDLVSAIFMEDPPLYGGEPDVHDATGIVPILRRSIDQEIAWTDRGASYEEAATELGETPIGPGLKFSDVMLPDSIHSLAASTMMRDRGVTESCIAIDMLRGLDTLSPLHRPAMVLAGNHEFGGAITPALEERLAATHPDVPVVRLASCGHGFQTWKRGRETYLTLLLGFLARHAPVNHG